MQFVSVLFFSGVKDGYWGEFWPGSDGTVCVADYLIVSRSVWHIACSLWLLNLLCCFKYSFSAIQRELRIILKYCEGKWLYNIWCRHDFTVCKCWEFIPLQLVPNPLQASARWLPVSASKLSHYHDQNLFLSPKIRGFLCPEFYPDLLLNRSSIQTLVSE